MNKLLALAGGLSALAMTAPANAVLLTYTVTGADQFATFTLDSNPGVDGYTTGAGFFIYDVEGTFTSGDYTTDIDDIYFFNAAAGGGLGTFDYYELGDFVILTDGPQLYTGAESAPTLLTGTFALADYFTGAPLTLTVTGPSTPGAVPEPASWAMLLTGFGLAGGALRARRTKVSFA